MNLAPGTRLDLGDGSAYLLGEPLPGEFRLPWRRARKLFRNYRHADRSLFEASAEEALDVLIRGPGPSPQAIEFELKQVFSIPGTDSFLEPIDVIHDDAGSFLVVADPHASPLREQPLAVRADVLGELNALLRLLSDYRLIPDILDPADILVDRENRPWFLGTDRFLRVEANAFQRGLTQLSERWDDLVQPVMPEGWKLSRASRRIPGSQTPARMTLRDVLRKLRRTKRQ
ncbi:MAG: hypothetical protein JWN86_801 [Planctomycetota bacterium]|nr:hypothetical protein [Planctomycetota bacterium]